MFSVSKVISAIVCRSWRLTFALYLKNISIVSVANEKIRRQVSLL